MRELRLRPYVCLVALLAFMQVRPSSAQTAPATQFQNDGSVSDAVWQLELLMAGTGPGGLGCKLPTVYATSADQLKNKGGAVIDNPQLQASLMQQLQLTPYSSHPTTFFDGFVTRLFDTPSTNHTFGALTDQELLGIVQQSTDPNALLMWGNASSVLKYDCNSVLKIAAQSNASHTFLDVASLQAAFDGSQTTSSSKSVIIVTGHAQSLFDIYYGPHGTLAERLFAALKGIEWYKGPLVGTMAAADQRLQHLSEAQIISFASTQNIGSNQNIAASLSASLSNIPLVSATASGSVSTQLSNAFQQMSSNFKTYYYDAVATPLPSLANMLSTAQSSVVLSNPSINNGTGAATVFPAAVVQMQGSITGWPGELCIDSIWTGGVSNTNIFTFTGSHLQAASANSTDGFPICNVSLAATVNSGSTAGSYDPKFTLTYKSDSSLAITIPSGVSLVNVVTTPAFAVSSAQVVPTPVPTSGTAPPQVQILWYLNGANLTNGQTIQSYSIDPVINCSTSDGTAIQLDSIFTNAYNSVPPYPYTFATSATTALSVNSPGTYQTIWLGYFADPTVYDVYAPTSAYQSCAISGKLHLTIGGSAADSSLSAKIIFPPKRSALTVRSVDCGQPAASPNLLSLSASTTAGATCTVYGNDLDLGSQIVISGGATTNIVLPLAISKDSSQAKFTIQATDIAKLTANTAYALTINGPSGPPIPVSLTLKVGP